MIEVNRFLRSMPRWATIFIAVLLVVIVGALDYTTGGEISFSIFFLLPIVILAVYVDEESAVCFSIMAAVTWFMVDVTTKDAYSHSAIPIWNAAVRLGFFLLVAVAFSGLKDAFVRERELARQDPLTGVANTKYFYHLAGREMERARRYERPFSIAYMDLDNFKEVNDSFGHSTGDEVLRLVTRTMKANLRETDIIARLGGDEFALLLPEAKAGDALAAMRKLRELILHNMRERGWPVTLSIGLVAYLEPPASVEEMVGEADALMYEVKKTTKNAIKQEIYPAA